MKKEILDPQTKEKVKAGELVDKGLAEISRSLRIYPKRTVKKLVDL